MEKTTFVPNAPIFEVSKQIIPLTVAELFALLMAFKAPKGAALLAAIQQRTKPKVVQKDRVTKEPNPYKLIEKVSYASIILNTDYEKGVINQLKKEGKEPEQYQKGRNTQPLTYGENNTFVGTTEKGEAMIVYRPNDNVKPKSFYFCDGVETEKAKIVNLLPLQYEATNQGTDREIQWRRVYLANVEYLNFNGSTYQVLP